jgi:hypothetical protein
MAAVLRNRAGILLLMGFLLALGLAGCTVVVTPTPLPPTPTPTPTPTPEIQATVAAAVALELARRPTSTPFIVQRVVPVTVVATPTRGPTPTPIIKEVLKEIVVTATPAPTPSATPLPSLGHSRLNPANIGTALFIRFKSYSGSYFEARITLLEVIRGDQARNIIDVPRWLDTDQPNPGFEWVLARVRFELLKTLDANTAFDVSPFGFAAISSQGKAYDSVNPNVDFQKPNGRMFATLYSGASHEGWVPLHVAPNDDHPLFQFDRHIRADGLLWWKLYK